MLIAHVFVTRRRHIFKGSATQRNQRVKQKAVYSANTALKSHTIAEDIN